MRNLFPGHYRPTDEEMSELWREAQFVFDTNVLLNLYSYPEAARIVFLSVLDKIADRVWIPYQVALEFHKNRFVRLRQSNKVLEDFLAQLQASASQLDRDFLKIEFEKRNTGVADLNERIAAAKLAIENLTSALKLACEKLPKVGLSDPIAETISGVFDKKVGLPPSDQGELDALIEGGYIRYDNNIPPGFGDAKKNEVIFDRGIAYPSKFGDLILWRQLISYASVSERRKFVFVTGDRKKDWWDFNEGMVLGPRPELVFEFLEQTKAERFWMYNVDQFLRFAEENIVASGVTQEAIEQVRKTSDEHAQKYENKITGSLEKILPTGSNWKGSISDLTQLDFDQFLLRPGDRVTRQLGHQLLRPLEKWLMERYSSRPLRSTYPSFVCESIDGLVGYQAVLGPIGEARILVELERASLNRDKHEIVKLVLAVVMPFAFADENLERTTAEMARIFDKHMTSIMVDEVIIGIIADGEFVERVRLEPII